MKRELRDIYHEINVAFNKLFGIFSSFLPDSTQYVPCLWL